MVNELDSCLRGNDNIDNHTSGAPVVRNDKVSIWQGGLYHHFRRFDFGCFDFNFFTEELQCQN